MRQQKNDFDEFLSCALIYEKNILLTSTLTQDFRDLTRTCVSEVPYANAYAQLPPPLRPQCFLMVLTQMLPRGLRLPYAATAPPYARMFSLRQLLRAAYAITTPLHF